MIKLRTLLSFSNGSFPSCSIRLERHDYSLHNRVTNDFEIRSWIEGGIVEDFRSDKLAQACSQVRTLHQVKSTTRDDSKTVVGCRIFEITSACCMKILVSISWDFSTDSYPAETFSRRNSYCLKSFSLRYGSFDKSFFRRFSKKVKNIS